MRACGLRLNSPQHNTGKKVGKETVVSIPEVPVAQWIEQRFPKPPMQVRFLPGIPGHRLFFLHTGPILRFLMAKHPKFPEAYFANASQTDAEIRGTITLISPRQARVARDICVTHCPHARGGIISCSTIGEDGVAHMSVDRRPQWPKWRQRAIARLFNAPCKVTWDAIFARRSR